MEKKKTESALRVNEGIETPEMVNVHAVERLKALKQNLLPAETYIKGIQNGDIVLLSKAITLVESALPAHQQLAQEVITACLPFSGKAIRLGITGVPGAGKSTFIEALGMFLINQGKKVAVLAIDPSSQRSKGSILGDKTRMEQLANQPAAYIRPSASAGTLGGVARKTRETIVLCEAAGFDTVIVETVGVGQSETAVHSMVDFFLLLMISGAGDELQGIKRGIMEMADGIAINKADGDNLIRAAKARSECEMALHLFPQPASGVSPVVTTCSALTNVNIDGVWKMVTDYIAKTERNGYLAKKRLSQAVQVMYDYIDIQLKAHFFADRSVNESLPALEQLITENIISAYQAATGLLEKYFGKQEEK
ncbi:MAG: methylmalonyl Co-A mutase-associated GTPase MeaB [Bacteroidales bacterium]|nr:methylmalonyl Co-A mutase-associated GTPase MeaB [Bacteroidales bacterium]